MKYSFTYGNVILSKFKVLEWQIEGSKFSTNPFEFYLNWKTKTDHAGISFTFSIYKLFWININLNDRRHWDFEKNCWKIYN